MVSDCIIKILTALNDAIMGLILIKGPPQNINHSHEISFHQNLPKTTIPNHTQAFEKTPNLSFKHITNTFPQNKASQPLLIMVSHHTTCYNNPPRSEILPPIHIELNTIIPMRLPSTEHNIRIS
ncbi:hypothetical protein ACOSQ2_004547 [Xanthoceras sorbifolium]